MTTMKQLEEERKELLAKCNSKEMMLNACVETCFDTMMELYRSIPTDCHAKNHPLHTMIDDGEYKLYTICSEDIEPLIKNITKFLAKMNANGGLLLMLLQAYKKGLSDQRELATDLRDNQRKIYKEKDKLLDEQQGEK